jgi:GNAT superfamily N-acetyltransferase
MSAAEIRPFDDIDGEGFARLAEAARGEGHRFLDRMANDWHAGTNRFAKPGECVLGAWVGATLAGVIGRNIDPHSADPTVGRLRHLYVRPDFRGSGIGASLVKAALAGAEAHFRLIRVRMGPGNERAAAMYLALGFSRLAGDPFATHMLSLRPDASPPTSDPIRILPPGG